MHRRHLAAAGGTPSPHNASVQVFAAPQYSSRVVWIADLLPNELKAPIEGMINRSMAVMKKTLDGMSRSKQLRAGPAKFGARWICYLIEQLGAPQAYFLSISKRSMGMGNTIVEARSPAISWSAAK